MDGERGCVLLFPRWIEPGAARQKVGLLQDQYVNWVRHHAARNVLFPRWIEPGAARQEVGLLRDQYVNWVRHHAARKGASMFSAHAGYAPTAEKPPTGRFFWVLLIGRLSGTFSLTKSSPICKTSVLQIFPSKGA